MIRRIRRRLRNKMVKDKCECKHEGKLLPGMAGQYDTEKELPFVAHKPGECKCTNELKEYNRDGETITLCSCCC